MTVVTQTEVLSPVAIHRAQPKDRVGLLAMYRSFEPKADALGLPPLREEDTEHWLEGIERFSNFLAKAGDAVVGHAVICPEGDSGEVAVFVHQDYRGQGMGRALLSELIKEARRLGVRSVWGIAAPDNVAMLRLARSCGFVPGNELGEFCLLLP